MGDFSAANSGNRIMRLVVVLLVVIVVNGLCLPVLAKLWKPFGNYGLATRLNWVVTAVDPGGAADKAGIAINDRINAKSLSLGDRLALTDSVTDAEYPYPPGRNMNLSFVHGNRLRSATLVSRPQPPSGALVPIINRLTALVFTIIGATLVLLKPSRMTWAFFAYACGSTAGSPMALALLPPGSYLTGEIVIDILTVAGWVGFLIFALRFPNDSVSGWRQRLDRAAPIAFAVLALLAIIIDVKLFLLGEGTASLQRTFDATKTLVTTTGIVALLITYLQLQGEGRQRIKWVATALGVQYLVDLVIFILGQPFVHPWGFFAFAYVLRGLYLGVPLSVAYAVLRHRVIDINFFISRALVYGILTSILAAIFTLLDFVFLRILDAGQLGLAVEVLVALGVGFWLNGVHRELDPVIDRLFFRQRYLSEHRLERAALALPHAQTTKTVDDYLVREPLDAFELTSAALFVRTDDGQFVREAAEGWTDSATRTLLHDDKMTLSLVAELSPVRVREVDSRRTDMPLGALAPVLAVPVIVRRNIKAIALYGPHSNGADFDVDEIQSLTRLAQSASTAYDHLEAEALRDQVAAQRAEIAELRQAMAKA